MLVESSVDLRDMQVVERGDGVGEEGGRETGIGVCREKGELRWARKTAL